MQIENKKPINVIAGYVRDLATEIPIYKYQMNEDENSIPKSYILLRSDLSNSTLLFGDGKSEIRQSDCDIILITKGSVTSTNSTHVKNIKKITDLLNSKEIPFTSFDLGYDKNLGANQYTFSVTVNYYG